MDSRWTSKAVLEFLKKCMKISKMRILRSSSGRMSEPTVSAYWMIDISNLVILRKAQVLDLEIYKRQTLMTLLIVCLRLLTRESTPKLKWRSPKLSSLTTLRLYVSESLSNLTLVTLSLWLVTTKIYSQRQNQTTKERTSSKDLNSVAWSCQISRTQLVKKPSKVWKL